MIKKSQYILILLMALMIEVASAQNNQVLYFMNLPQNRLINPALRPSNSLYIGLPVISGINLNVNNNFVNFSDVFIKGQPSDSIISFLHPDYNVGGFLDKIKDKNSLAPQIAVQLFGLGFSAGKDLYVFLDINERVEGNGVLPGDLFELGLSGNEGFIGKKIDLSSVRGDLKYYREIGLGFSKNFTNKLRIGVKGKLLFGIAGASLDNRSFGITVNDDFTHTLNADMMLNISGPVTIPLDADNHPEDIVFDQALFNTTKDVLRFAFSLKNMGLGLDIGAVYDISEKLMVSAAITDIGFIRWKKDVTNLQAKSQFDFSGLNMLDVFNGTKTFEELGQEMLDSLQNSFIVSDTYGAFTTYLPFSVTLGGSYNLTSNFSLGLLSNSRVIGNQIRESLTMSAIVNLGSALSTSLTYTIANHRFDNLGAGLAFRAGVVQFYFLADRIPLMWNKINVDNSTIPLPANWNTISLRLGMNLVFGNAIRKKVDRPMVLVE